VDRARVGDQRVDVREAIDRSARRSRVGEVDARRTLGCLDQPPLLPQAGGGRGADAA
jgi:hypothetical protein